MSTSQNGWPVVKKTACDQGPFAGVTFPNGILKGDVATIARWQLAQYEARVEPLVAGTCWGWYVKTIEGSKTISNHASATAWDCNADRHPMGTPAAANFHTYQIEQCREIVAESGGVLRWGGDFGRPDPMHWEIHKDSAAVRAFADKIRKAENMDEASIWGTQIPLQAPRESAAGALWEIHERMPVNLAGLLPAIADLSAKVDQLLAKLDQPAT